MKRYAHRLSNYKLTTFNQGQFVPVRITEALMGDTFRHSTSAFLRVSPPAFPVMHPVHVYIKHFAVPVRLIWEDFSEWITGKNEDAVHPTIKFKAKDVTIGSLAQHLGVPIPHEGCDPEKEIEVSALPFRAYAFIFNEYIRDQDLQQPLVFSTASGLDTTTNTTLQNVCWEKDPFTLARPTPQQGDEVYLPLGDSAPVSRTSFGTWTAIHAMTGEPLAEGDTLSVGQNGVLRKAGTSTPAGFQPTGLTADLSQATATPITLVQEAFALQRMKQARNKYGERYEDYLRYLGIKPSDARLQKPEYLGGGKQTIQFSEVLGTSADALGALGGHGIAAMRSNAYQFFFEEHSLVCSFMFVRPKTMYSQGLDKLWLKRTKDDYWQKELENIGQDKIVNQQLMAFCDKPDGTFGYTDRYYEYKRACSTYSGEFASVYKDAHMGREFNDLPALNASFVSCNPTDRIYLDKTSDQIIVMVYHNLRARRMVSKKGAV